MLAVGLIAAAVVAGGAAAVFRTARSQPPLPPALAALGSLAPEIADIVRQARESIVQDPRDGLR